MRKFTEQPEAHRFIRWKVSKDVETGWREVENTRRSTAVRENGGRGNKESLVRGRRRGEAAKCSAARGGGGGGGRRCGLT